MTTKKPKSAAVGDIQWPMIHWRWQTADGEMNRHLCTTTEEERDQERSVILKPVDTRTKGAPKNECALCAKLGKEAGIW